MSFKTVLQLQKYGHYKPQHDMCGCLAKVYNDCNWSHRPACSCLPTSKTKKIYKKVSLWRQTLRFCGRIGIRVSWSSNIMQVLFPPKFWSSVPKATNYSTETANNTCGCHMPAFPQYTHILSRLKMAHKTQLRCNFIDLLQFQRLVNSIYQCAFYLHI